MSVSVLTKSSHCSLHGIDKHLKKKGMLEPDIGNNIQIQADTAYGMHGAFLKEARELHDAVAL